MAPSPIRGSDSRVAGPTWGQDERVSGTHPISLRYGERSSRERRTDTEGGDVVTVDDDGAIRRAHRDGMFIRQIGHSRRTVRHALGRGGPRPGTGRGGPWSPRHRIRLTPWR